MTKRELEERLVDFAVEVTKIVTAQNKNRNILHLNDQAIRSSTSCALNYGEVQGAVSRKDFLHKAGIVMKELRETYINLTIIKRLNDDTTQPEFHDVIKENNELLAIFFRSIQTARSKL